MNDNREEKNTISGDAEQTAAGGKQTQKRAGKFLKRRETRFKAANQPPLFHLSSQKIERSLLGRKIIIRAGVFSVVFFVVV